MVVHVRAGAVDFETWVTARHTRLLRFAYLLTGDKHAAEEALQDALASAWSRWDRISEVDDPDRYVRRMIANAHVSGWRRFRKRESSAAEIRTADQPDPSGDIARNDAVWRVCRALPERQRAAVVLRFYEDLDYSEIAATLGVTESTVRSAVHRALAALRTELQRQEADHA